MIGKKPEVLEFPGCAEGREQQVRVLLANCRMRGANAAQAQDSLRRDASLPPLIFGCCRRETVYGGHGVSTFVGVACPQRSLRRMTACSPATTSA